MMRSVTYEVDFRVRAHTRPDEIVCVSGDCAKLGNWNPHCAVKLRRDSSRQHSLDESEIEKSSESGDVWSTTVRLSGWEEISYRYFTCTIFESETEDSEKMVLVKRWETNIKPRIFSPQDSIKVVDAGVSKESYVSVFGEYDGKRHVTWGWLTSQSELHIRLIDNPIKMWKRRYNQQMYRVKCTPLDHRYRDEGDQDEEEDYMGDALPQSTCTPIFVSVLDDDRCKQSLQGKYGTLYNKDDYMIFIAQSFEPEYLGFQLDFFVHDVDANKGVAPKHIGYSYILPLKSSKSIGCKTIPITGLKHKPIGEIKVDYLVVKPTVGTNFNLSVSYQQYWKETRGAVDVGHRGMGNSYKCKQLATVRENTVQSLMSAASHGADFVEFDVQLSKDKIPVIYHDFHVCITYRKKKKDDLELLLVPVKDLKLAELQQMKLSHVSSLSENCNDDIHADDIDPEDLQPFPTLQRCFEAVDIHTGFNIEFKYPQTKKDETPEVSGYFDLNQFVDITLNTVFAHAGERRLIFSSFDPDTCIMLRLKQNKYPVLFLTQADTKVWTPYADLRTRTLSMAKNLARAHNLLGVDVYTEVLLRDMSSIEKIKEAGLVLFCWGEDNNDSNMLNSLKDAKVDGIIYDRIDFYKTTKESIFKIEKKAKVKLFHQFSGATVIAPELTDSGGESS